MKKKMVFLARIFTQTQIAITAITIALTMYACKPDLEALNGSKVNSENNSAARVGDYTLKSISNFKVGCAEEFGRAYGNNPVLQTLIKNEYDRLTSNEFKMDFVNYEQNGNINFTNFDNELNFAKTNGLDIFGHSLIYNISSPAWFKNVGTKEELEFAAKRYIQTMIKRAELPQFGGVLKGVDIANELFNYDGRWNGVETNTNVQKWRNLYASDDEFKRFIGRCFQWAREADNLNGATNIKLFYNDYDQEASQRPEKRNAIYAFCAWLKNNGYPIDGIGLQFHLLINDNPVDNFDRPTTFVGVSEAIEKAAQLENGFFDIHISELDFRMDRNITSAPLYNYAEQWKQYDLARFVVNKYRTTVNVNKQFGVTLWNITDKYSWFNQPYFDGNKPDKDFPTVFDANSNRKIAYYGFLSGAASNNQFFLPENYFHLYNQGSGKFAEVENGSLADAALIKQRYLKSSNNRQVFQLIYNNAGFYNLRNINSNKLLDHYASEPFSLQQYGSEFQSTANNRLFSFVGLGKGVFKISGKTVYANNTFKTLQAPSVTEGATIKLGTANDQNGFQYWRLEE